MPLGQPHLCKRFPKRPTRHARERVQHQKINPPFVEKRVCLVGSLANTHEMFQSPEGPGNHPSAPRVGPSTSR